MGAAMTNTKGIKSHGTKLAIGDGASPEAFSNLPEGTAVPAIGGKKGLIDATSHDTVGFMDYIPKALADGNELKVTSNYIPKDANVAKFKAAYIDQLHHNFKSTLVDGTTFVFPGIISEWEVDPSEMDGMVKASFSIKIVGEPVESNPV
jgi:hypothetical protein